MKFIQQILTNFSQYQALRLQGWMWYGLGPQAEDWLEHRQVEHRVPGSRHRQLGSHDGGGSGPWTLAGGIPFWSPARLNWELFVYSFYRCFSYYCSYSEWGIEKYTDLTAVGRTGGESFCLVCNHSLPVISFSPPGLSSPASCTPWKPVPLPLQPHCYLSAKAFSEIW